MRKRLMVIGNAVIVSIILFLVTVYVSQEQKRILASQIASFSNMNAAMESVTTNYVVGEQQVCNSWANYISANEMTAEEALSFVRSAITSPQIMAHILFTDSENLAGLSTTARPQTVDDYTVSYENVSLYDDSFNEIFMKQSAVNVTRIYTNPTNGVQSIAFCCPVRLKGNISAILLRILPMSYVGSKWTFPMEQYKDAEIALIDTSGNYIIKDSSFKDSNFFEFYSSYNSVQGGELEKLMENVSGGSGVIELLDSTGRKRVVAHSRINSTHDWVILSMIPLDELGHLVTNWTIVGIVTVGLLLLMLFNLLIMKSFNHQLKSAIAEADRANRAKTEFLSTMSHDIRTPMNAIIGLTLIAGKNIEDTSTVRENLRKINLASNHLLTLINDILDISKVESGRLNLSPVSFSVVECAENLVNISHPMVKEKNIDFNFRINRFEHEYLYADQLRFNQIFVNLLSNAIKYTEPGGKVCVDLKEEAGNSENTVILTYVVEDTGMGMSPEFMTHMYQPFSRQTDSRVNSIQGTGLGLTITKRMVDLMNGTIECQSEVGKGTIFTVRLELPISERKTEDMVLPSVKVLLADDDDILLETAKDTLSSIGADVDTARTGTEALEKATSDKGYQVVILDWKMPDIDGIEVARQIRARVGDGIPIVLVSAYDWSDLEDSAKAVGIDGFISKPLFRSTLYYKLSELLGNEKVHAEEDDDSLITGMRILVVEDNDINWEIISMLLSMHGVESERAENGKIAVERLQNSKNGDFNLVFMDIQMPVMNGIEATKAIRALPDCWASSIPIIAMTADAFSENVSECLAAGMNGHIAKPVDIKLVLKEIRRIKDEERD
ncbi:MAG: response regulator [Spirochaetales bacterium]|nr:response regulator [Spirochaetales bacterium]